jgi:putative monooxygenase
VSEHYHPYSEEFIYVVSGQLDAQLDGKSNRVNERQALLIPMNVRHRLVNDGDKETFLVFHLGPLAPRPELGHVDTE